MVVKQIKFIHLLAIGAALTFLFTLWVGLKQLTQPSELDSPPPRLRDSSNQAEIDQYLEAQAWTTQQASEAITSTLKNLFDPDADPEDWPDFVAGGQTTAALMRQYYQQGRGQSSPLKSLLSVEPRLHGEQTIWFVSFLDMANQRQFASFVASGKRLLLHWQAMVAYGEMDWADFETTQTEQATQMRALVRTLDSATPTLVPSSLSAATSHQTPPDAWQPVIVRSRDNFFEQIAWFSPQHTENYQILKRLPANSDHPLTLDLRYQHSPPNHPALVIDKVRHFGWTEF